MPNCRTANDKIDSKETEFGDKNKGRWAFLITFVILIVVAFAFYIKLDVDHLQSIVIGVSTLGGIFLRNILSDIFAGIVLFIRAPFSIGHYVVLDKSEGWVEDIQMQVTILRGNDNSRIMIPNAELLKGSICVKTAYKIIQRHFDLHFPLTTDLSDISDAIVAVVKALPDVEGDPPPTVTPSSITDGQVIISVHYWVSSVAEFEVNGKVITAISQLLQERGIWADLSSVDQKKKKRENLLLSQKSAPPTSNVWPAAVSRSSKYDMVKDNF